MKITAQGLKKYYETYYKDMELNEDELKKELENWRYYRDKIINNEFTAEDYNSKNSNFKRDDEHKSLRNFIENETYEVGSFGSMVSGKLVLWVTNDGDNKEYYYRVKANGRYPSTKDSKLEGEDQIKEKTEEIRKFLQNVIENKQTLDSLIEYFNNEDEGKTIYDSIRKNFLEKIIIFNSMLDETKDFDYHNKLIFIYDFSNLSKVELMDGKTNLFEVLKSDKNNLKKNKEITENVLKVLGIEEPNYLDLVKIERMLWSLYKNSDRDLLLSKQKKNIIFYGAPGTGKTYIVKQILENKSIEDLKENNKNDDEMDEDNEVENNEVNPEDIVTSYLQFHPSFTYEDFIEGIKPLGIDNNGNLKLGVVNGCFKEFCMLAKKHPTKEFYFVVDEINRCNLSSVFGETLSLLENDYRWSEKSQHLLQTPLSKVIESMINNAKDEDEKKELIEKYAFEYKNGKVYFGIPENIHFIGMMNDCDKSIDSFDLALRRRFIWVRKEFDSRVLYLNLVGRDDNLRDIYINIYLKACKRLNAFIVGDDYGEGIPQNSLHFGKTFEIGHAIFMKVRNQGSKDFKTEREEIWNEHLEPTIKEYLRSSYLESDIDSKLNEARDLFLKKE